MHNVEKSPSHMYIEFIFSQCRMLSLRGGEKVVWVPAEEYKEPVDEKRKRKKKQSL